MMPRIRVIAWGNTGRRDDGVALALADRLTEYFAGDPRVQIEQCHQLSPELALDLHENTAVVFVDAHVREEGLDVEFEPIAPTGSSALDTHHCGPRALLRLCEVLSGAVPESYLLTIRAYDTRFGDGLSLQTNQAMLEAQELLTRFILTRQRVLDWERVVPCA